MTRTLSSLLCAFQLEGLAYCQHRLRRHSRDVQAQVLVEIHQLRREKEEGQHFVRSANYLFVSGSPRSLSAVAMCDFASCMRFVL